MSGITSNPIVPPADESTITRTTGTLAVKDNGIAGTKIAMGSDAQGDILFYNGTDYARLGAGTSGQVLKTQGASANPIWSNQQFNLITTTTVSPAGVTATFSSIPTGYKFLKITGVVKKSSTNISNLKIQMNADTGNNYDYSYFALNGTTVSGASSTAQGAITFAGSATNITDGTNESGLDIEIQQPSTTKQKTVNIKLFYGSGGLQHTSGAWKNTADEITSIVITADQNMADGTVFNLWGA